MDDSQSEDIEEPEEELPSWEEEHNICAMAAHEDSAGSKVRTRTNMHESRKQKNKAAKNKRV